MICGAAKRSATGDLRQGNPEPPPVWPPPAPTGDADDYRDRLLDSLTRRYRLDGPLTPTAVAEAVAEAQGGVGSHEARFFPTPSPAPLRQQDLSGRRRAGAPKRVTL